MRTVRFTVAISIVMLGGLTAGTVMPADAKPKPAVSTGDRVSTFAGRVGYSADGLGAPFGGLVDADVPAGSHVLRAYLYLASNDGGPCARLASTVPQSR